MLFWSNDATIFRKETVIRDTENEPSVVQWYCRNLKKIRICWHTGSLNDKAGLLLSVKMFGGKHFHILLEVFHDPFLDSNNFLKDHKVQQLALLRFNLCSGKGVPRYWGPCGQSEVYTIVNRPSSIQTQRKGQKLEIEFNNVFQLVTSFVYSPMYFLPFRKRLFRWSSVGMPVQRLTPRTACVPP
jgi:hypothetical protein